MDQDARQLVLGKAWPGTLLKLSPQAVAEGEQLLAMVGCTTSPGWRKRSTRRGPDAVPGGVHSGLLWGEKEDSPALHSGCA